MPHDENIEAPYDIADMMPPHECIDHLVYREHEWVEPHGEHCYQEWYECLMCATSYSVEEADFLADDRRKTP